MSSRVLVLGGIGMLGNAVVQGLHGEADWQISATSRFDVADPPVPFVPYAVGSGDLDAVLHGFGPDDYVINCIGLVKNRIDDGKLSDRLEAIRVNSDFPHELADRAGTQGFRVVQIATDCVYSGRAGGYDESAIHDPVDVYGATKSLGEVPHERFLNIRCSIIGRELRGTRSLAEWLLSQPLGGTVRGYLDHHWNGVTTSAFASLVRGLIATRSELSGTFHFLPADTLDKNELCRLILAAFDRQDVVVAPTVTGDAIDRTLATRYPDVNASFWDLAGYPEPPTIADMVDRLR